MSIALAHAHPHGGLNAEGCHTNRKTGEYHCHRKAADPQETAERGDGKKKACVSFPRCQGCGCKGGPGYRNNSTGRCVGYKTLVNECSPYLHAGCTFENAPGTGVNKGMRAGRRIQFIKFMAAVVALLSVPRAESLSKPKQRSFAVHKASKHNTVDARSVPRDIAHRQCEQQIINESTDLQACSRVTFSRNL
ncbi:MAG: YHYH domain-containing protein [Hyphomicrobiales bacterium]